jgi:hypothetical protein
MAYFKAQMRNSFFENKTIEEAVDYTIKQDPQTPTRFITKRARYRDDERLVREYALNPEVKEGFWRMYQAGKVNCTCEAIALHFWPDDEDIREAVKRKLEQLTRH